MWVYLFHSQKTNPETKKRSVVGGAFEYAK